MSCDPPPPPKKKTQPLFVFFSNVLELYPGPLMANVRLFCFSSENSIKSDLTFFFFSAAAAAAAAAA
eukprot:COSAG06_NODE_26457_length_614_cov_1.180583_1_plen_66_part_10